MKNSNLTSSIPIRKEVRTLKPSATLVINEKSKEMIRNGKKVYKLGFGQSPFPVPETVVQALKDHAAEKDYCPVKGLWPTREAVADYMSIKHSQKFIPDNVIIGPGSKELMFLFQLAFNGQLILPSPCWVSYEPQAQLAGKKPVFIPTTLENNWCIQPSDLEKVCLEQGNTPKYIILNYPNNPSGTTYSAEELKSLAEVCRKYNVVVVSDEIYGELTYTSEHQSIIKYYPEGTIITGGLSKWAGAGGWRFGAMIVPTHLKPLLDVMANIASETFSAVSTPVQYAAITAYRPSKEVEEYLDAAKSALKAVGMYVYENLKALNVKMAPPQGGFYLMPDFGYYSEVFKKNGITTSHQMCQHMLENSGIAMLPGSEFARPENEFTTRLCYVDFDGKLVLEKIINEGQEVNHEFVKTNCPNIANAMIAFKEYLEHL